MPQRLSALRALLIALLLLLVLLTPALGLTLGFVDAAGPQAACRVEACAANCVAHQFVLGHGNMNTFSYWYRTAYTLTGCDDPDWWTNFTFLLAIAAEIVGAPGGYTMDCREMTLGQYKVCLDQCKANPCRYTPNVRATLDACGRGQFGVTYDHDRGETLPEYQPTAYSRDFSSDVYLTGPSGTPLLLARHDVPTLAFNNWTLWGDAVATCPTIHGDSRCDLLALFDQPTAFSFALDWGDGLYDLWINMSDNQGVDSWPGDDHLRLLSDGDSLTIKQGNISGYVWERHRTRSGLGDWSPWHDSVTPWDAAGGGVTFTNHESNAWYHWTRTDRDTVVYATRGEARDLLSGSYTLRAEAHLAHDKDLADHSAACTFDVSAPPPPTPTPPPWPSPPAQATATPPSGAGIIDIGPGVWPGALADADSEDVYRLQVPAGLAALRVTLGGMVSGDFDLDLFYGAPDPHGVRVCRSSRGGLANEECRLIAPAAGAYYIHVPSFVGDGPYTLTVAFETVPEGATPTAPATAQPTITPYSGQSESEPNDSRDTADVWEANQGPMRGQFNTSGDIDYFRWSADAPAIYTVTLSDVPDNIVAELFIYAEGGRLVARRTGAAPGESVQLSLDGNAGDIFWVRVRAASVGQTSSGTFRERGAGQASSDSGEYRLDLSAAPDPFEPDDTRDTATSWDWRSGPIQGYFFELASGDADYYAFELSAQEPAMLLTVHLDDVSPEVAPDLTIYHHGAIVATEYSAPLGGSIALTVDANPGDAFVARVRPRYRSQTSFTPYTLSATQRSAVLPTATRTPTATPTRGATPFRQ